eukprot:3322792-Amphidinium_carterae.1
MKHPVARTEMAAISVAMLLWAEKLRGMRCLASIDNTAVVQAFVKGQSSDEFMRKCIRAVSGVAVKMQPFVAYHRVPTAANPADQPSRGVVNDFVERWGCVDRDAGPHLNSLL